MPRANPASRKNREKPAKVFTNDNIPTSGGISVAGAKPAGKEGAASADTTAALRAIPPARTKKPGATNSPSCARSCESDQENLDVMQRELGVLSMQYYPDPNKAMQQQLSRDDINKKTSDIDNKKKDVANDEQAISDAEDDLRKAGGDPGWAR